MTNGKPGRSVFVPRFETIGLTRMATNGMGRKDQSHRTLFEM